MSTPSISVRELTALKVVLENGSFTMALDRSSLTSDVDHLKKMRTQFLRKLDNESKDTLFCVLGFPALSDDDPDRIFEVIYWVPFEKDAIWEGTAVGTVGAIALAKPGRGALHAAQRNDGANESGQNQKRTKRRVQPPVCVYCPLRISKPCTGIVTLEHCCTC